MEEEKNTSEMQKSDSRPDHSQLNACVAALVIVVLVGILKSKGIL